jgi:hypothetical protein
MLPDVGSRHLETLALGSHISATGSQQSCPAMMVHINLTTLGERREKLIDHRHAAPRRPGIGFSIRLGLSCAGWTSPY